MSELQSSIRIRAIHDRPPAPDRQYVLYWMIGARRHTWNSALDRAVDWGEALGLPVVVLEGLACDYRWASDRMHRFVIDGMRDTRAGCEQLGLGYYPYVEPEAGAGRGLLARLAADAAVVVTDRAPVFELPGFVAAAGRQLAVRFEEVDGNGILPLDAAAPDHIFPTAYAFRRFLQRSLGEHLPVRPREQPLTRGTLRPPPELPPEVLQRWPPVTRVALEDRLDLSVLPIDHGVPPTAARGGSSAAAGHLAAFIDHRLARYHEDRNHPDDDLGSGLSPYLHFGHISAHEVVTRVLRAENWSLSKLARTASGKKTGWWNTAPGTEAFLDQVVTWRELGFNMAARRDDYTRFESLPDWAQKTLVKHESDARPERYSLDELAAAATTDELWNAAQRQLVEEGRIHNYLRMLWGKKILEWSPTPREALDVMVELNNRYGIDGRDPNSCSGIFWVLGRYDRPWPERPIFGTVRYMTSASTKKKLRVKRYLERYGAGC